jgi:O-acetyl-ADP-ribose deacetylase (regulator of RNase III)
MGQSSLNLAIENGIRTIAFPAICCGAYRFPIQNACRIAVNEVSNFLSEHESIEKVIFACFDKTVQRELIKQLAERKRQTITILPAVYKLLGREIHYVCLLLSN